jgi:hypothetical protein
MELFDIKQNFINNCNKGFCLRKVFKNIKCNTQLKQEKCFEKYIKQVEKDSYKFNKKDEKWELLKQQLFERDQECQIEKVLTKPQIKNIKLLYDPLFSKVNNLIDGMHIIPRSVAPELIYDLDNVLLGKRFYHGCIDRNENFFINAYEKDFRENFLTMIMRLTNKWEKDYTYLDFIHDKFKSKENI